MEPEGMRPETTPSRPRRQQQQQQQQQPTTAAGGPIGDDAAGRSSAAASASAASASGAGAQRRRASLDFLPSYARGGGGSSPMRLSPLGGAASRRVAPAVLLATATGLKDSQPPLLDCPGFPQSGFASHRQQAQPGRQLLQQSTPPTAGTGASTPRLLLAPPASDAAPRPPRRASLTLTHSSHHRAAMRGGGAIAGTSRSAHGPAVAARGQASLAMNRRVRSFDDNYGRPGASVAAAAAAAAAGTAPSPTRRTQGALQAGASHQHSPQHLQQPSSLHLSSPRRRLMHRRASADFHGAAASASPAGPSSASSVHGHGHHHGHPSPYLHGGRRQGSRSLAQRRHSASVRLANAAAAEAALSHAQLASPAGSTDQPYHNFAAAFHEDTTTATPTSLVDYDWDASGSGSNGAGMPSAAAAAGVMTGADPFGDDDSVEEFGGDEDDAPGARLGVRAPHIRADPTSTMQDFPNPWEDDPFLAESPKQPSGRRPRLRLAANAAAAAAATTLNTRSVALINENTAPAAAPTRGTATAKAPGAGENGFVADFDLDCWGDGSPLTGKAPQTPSSFAAPPSSSLSPPPTTTATQARLNRFRRSSSFQPGTRVERNSRRSQSRGRSASVCSARAGTSAGVGASAGAGVARPIPAAPAPSPSATRSCPKTPKTPRVARSASSRSLQNRSAAPAASPQTPAASLTSPASGRSLASPAPTSGAAGGSRHRRGSGNGSSGEDARGGIHQDPSPGRSVFRAVAPQNVPVRPAGVCEAPLLQREACAGQVSFQAPSGHDAGDPGLRLPAARRSGRRPSSSPGGAAFSVDGTESQAFSSKLAAPAPAKAGIPYPATPSTVASSESHSVASSRVAALRGGVVSPGGSGVGTPAPISPHPDAPGPSISPPSHPSLARALNRTGRASHRRASASSANCDSQSVRSSLSRLHRNHQHHQVQQQQQQQRRTSSSGAGPATAIPSSAGGGAVKW